MAHCMANHTCLFESMSANWRQYQECRATFHCMASHACMFECRRFKKCHFHEVAATYHCMASHTCMFERLSFHLSRLLLSCKPTIILWVFASCEVCLLQLPTALPRTLVTGKPRLPPKFRKRRSEKERELLLMPSLLLMVVP